MGIYLRGKKRRSSVECSGLCRINVVRACDARWKSSPRASLPAPPVTTMSVAPPVSAGSNAIITRSILLLLILHEYRKARHNSRRYYWYSSSQVCTGQYQERKSFFASLRQGRKLKFREQPRVRRRVSTTVAPPAKRLFTPCSRCPLRAPPACVPSSAPTGTRVFRSKACCPRPDHSLHASCARRGGCLLRPLRTSGIFRALPPPRSPRWLE